MAKYNCDITMTNLRAACPPPHTPEALYHMAAEMLGIAGTETWENANLTTKILWLDAMATSPTSWSIH
jgi:hypothetical protein